MLKPWNRGYLYAAEVLGLRQLYDFSDGLVFNREIIAGLFEQTIHGLGFNKKGRDSSVLFSFLGSGRQYGEHSRSRYLGPPLELISVSAWYFDHVRSLEHQYIHKVSRLLPWTITRSFALESNLSRWNICEESLRPARDGRRPSTRTRHALSVRALVSLVVLPTTNHWPGTFLCEHCYVYYVAKIGGGRQSELNPQAQSKRLYKAFKGLLQRAKV